MGGIYTRGNKLWFWYVNADGERQWGPSGLAVGEESKAKQALEVIERRIEAEVLTGIPSGELTVKAYGEKWLKARPEQGVATAKDETTRLRLHAWPLIGDHLLKDIRTRHIRDAIRSLRGKKSKRGTPLAPRTIRHVYGTLHTMFREAVVDELLSGNPCVVKKEDLPAKRDRDLAWRKGAIFHQEEVELLLSDARIPEPRRVLYAVLFLTGMRIGEVSALHWRGLDLKAEPLGRILVEASYDRKTKQETTLKTENPRQVPIHPTLAKVLASWKLSGWQRALGEQPGPDDLLLPSMSDASFGGHLINLDVLYWLHLDLDALGYRHRRTHDARRTFISLALGDGARKDILRWITHGPTGDIMDLYTTLRWSALCDEVVKLRLEVREGKLLRLPVAVGARPPSGGCDSDCDSPLQKLGITRGLHVHETGLEPSLSGEPGVTPVSGGEEFHGPAKPGGSPGGTDIPDAVTDVTAIDRAVRALAREWELSGDLDALRHHLTLLVRMTGVSR